MEHAMCFDFLYQRLSETFLTLRRTERDIAMNVHGSSGTVVAIMLNVNETCTFRHVFEKYSKIKFHGNSCGGSRVVPCRQTDRQA